MRPPLRALGAGRQDEIDPERPVLIDETATKASIERLKGTVSAGRRPRGQVSGSPLEREAFIPALSSYRIEAVDSSPPLPPKTRQCWIRAELAVSSQ